MKKGNGGEGFEASHQGTHLESVSHAPFLAVSIFTLSLLLPTAAAFATTPTPSSILSPVFGYQNTTPTVDGASGALTEQVPIDIPPGRNGLQPDLSLDYNSQDTAQDSIVGYGWTLSIPYIERLNKTGSENLYGPNAYFTSSIDGELASASSGVSGGVGTTTSTVQFLVVSGGGGGGAGQAGNYIGGGGGAGGMATGSATISAGSYAITVGSGGAGGVFGVSAAANGGNSSFDTIASTTGGARGGDASSAGTHAGANGGSGGGGGLGASGGSGITGQGSNGGSTSGSNGGSGGGGAGSVGSANSGLNGGVGGNGSSSAITGSSVTYAGGGGGGGDTGATGGSGGSGGGGTGAGGSSTTATAGTNGTGGGGGGGGSHSGNQNGANGGSGVVVVNYPTASASDYTCGGTVTTSGSSTICSYTSSGTFTYGPASTSTPLTLSTYLPRVDNGSFHQYAYSTSTNSWIMFDKKGTEYFFGATAESQQSSTTNSANIYKWMLNKVLDTNGNYIRYTYTKDHNQVYPSEIIYTGHGSSDGPMAITFATTTRTDTGIDYLPGFEVDTNYLISQITVEVSSTSVRQYNLAYTTGNNSYRSLLSSVQESGWNASGSQTTLPPWTFGYTSSSTSFVTGFGTGTSINNPFGDYEIAADANGDGINEQVNLHCTGFAESFLVTPSAGSPTPPQISNLCWSYVNQASETGTRFVDVNGDGKPDIIQSETGSGDVAQNAYLTRYATSTGYAWASTTLSGAVPIIALTSNTAHSITTGIFADVNGTGLPSFTQRIDGQLASTSYIANGSGWDSTTTVFTPPTSFPYFGTQDCTDAQLVDVNGDGLPDWVYNDSTSTRVILNNGQGWSGSPDPRWAISTSSVYSSGGNCYDRGMRFVDINGDGLPDFIRSYSNTGNTDLPETGTYQFVYLNTGHGWATSTAYTLSTHIIDGTAVSGVNEVGYNDYANFQGNGQQNQDVLSTSTNPKGEITAATYGYTTQTGSNPNLPYNLLVVTKTVTNDGRGNMQETDDSYSGGLQYLPSNVFDRKFAGFADVTASTSVSTVTTYYSQGSTTTAATAGDQSDGFGQLNHPYRQDTATPSGTLVQSIFYQYNPIFHGGSEFVGLTRQLEQDYAADGSHRDKDTEYAYSTSTDDLVQTIDYGEVTGNSNGTFSTTSASTIRTTDIAYAASSSINLEVPTEKTLFGATNATTTDAKYFYDGLSFGQVTLGNETQEQDWVSGSQYASSTKTYNAFGLVATSTDLDGNATAYAYDALDLYPATTTNALGQSTSYAYNYSNGKVATSTDPNKAVTRNIFDGVGRLIETDESNTASPSTLISKSTFGYTDSTTTPSLIHEADYLNSATSTDTYDYYDGLDRLIQERKSTETGGTFAVTDKTYNFAGLLASQSLPYFSSGSGNTTATSTSALFTAYTYDPLNRPRTALTAVGTTTNVYSKWTTTTTDPNGDVKDYTLDAFGNLAQVVEHNTSGNATTTYAYDAANNLATTTDALGNIRTFAYDGLGRRVSATDLHASGAGSYGTWSYSYDDQGNETSRADPKSQTITHTYDPLNRMLTESWTGHGTQISDTYDSCANGIGHICTASTSAAVDTFAYDVLGDTTNATTTVQGTAYGMAYGYDRQGNITSATNASDGSKLNYTYNSAGLVSSVSRTTNATTSQVASIFNFSPEGQVGQLLFGSGASTTYSYNPTAMYRLTRIVTVGSSTQSATSTTVHYLVVGGGGGGGAGQAGNYIGGGGGAGGVLSGTTTVSTGNLYSITVGAGGIGGTCSGTYSTNGGNSSFDVFATSIGGGAGGGTDCATATQAGQSGGSGGGGGLGKAGGTGTSGQGNAGASTSGSNGGSGGGGAGSTGTSNGGLNGGAGGNGTSSSISGASVTYGGGGGGGGDTGATGGSGGSGGGGTGASDTSTIAIAGTDGLGGGGGGGGSHTTNQSGANGGSGIVILSAPIGEISATGGTHTQSGGNDIWTFTSSGTFSDSLSVPQDTNYTYDANGNVLTRTDNSVEGGGQRVTYTYDDLNRLLSASTTLSNTNSYDQTFTYDALGNILTSPAGTYTYGGGSGANPDAVTETQLTIGASAPIIGYDNSTIAGNGTPASSLTFSYTVNNNTNGLIAVPVVEATTSPSCTSDKVTGVTDNGASLSDPGYYVRNTSIGALKTYYLYSPTQGTHNVVVSASASCILYAGAETFTGVKQSGFPDASGTGNPLSDSGAVTLFQATTTTSNYNSWALLIGVPSQTGTATAGSNTVLRQQQSGALYFGDSNGPVAPAGAIGLSWSMPTSHWIANYFSITPVISNPGTTYVSNYSYDLNGDLTQITQGSTSTTYAYDYLNRLATSTVPGGHTTTYGYDAFGNRVFEITGNTTTVFPSKWYEVTTLASATSSGTSTDFVYLPAQAGQNDRLLATVDQPLVNGIPTGSSTLRYIHTDNLGSTQVTSDGSGNLSQWFDYAPYGNVLASSNTGTTTAARQYIGQFSDASGLSYFQNRYYNPGQGQFISEDPTFLAIGNSIQVQQLTGEQQTQILANPQQLNSSAYSHDNPINSSDPRGLLGPDTPFEMAFATPAGAVLGFVGQATSDYRSGQLSPITDYWASEFGGAVGLNLALDSDGVGVPVSLGVGGATTEATKEFFNNVSGSQSGFSVGEIGGEFFTSTFFGLAVPDLNIAPVNGLASYAENTYGEYANTVFGSLSNTLRAASAQIASQVIRGSPSTVVQSAAEGNSGLAGVKQTLLGIQTTLNSLASSPASSQSSSHH